MNIKFLGVIIMAFQLTSSVYGVNHKLLDSEADTYHQRIWSGIQSDEKMVKRSLAFINDDETFDQTYSQPETFNKLYEQVINEIKDDNFLKFSQACRNVFEEKKDNKKKAAVYMLLEKVKEKSLKHLSSLKKLEEFKNQSDKKLKESDPNKSLEYFLNIDKVAKVN